MTQELYSTTPELFRDQAVRGALIDATHALNPHDFVTADYEADTRTVHLYKPVSLEPDDCSWIYDLIISYM